MNNRRKRGAPLAWEFAQQTPWCASDTHHSNDHHNDKTYSISRGGGIGDINENR